MGLTHVPLIQAPESNKTSRKDVVEAFHGHASLILSAVAACVGGSRVVLQRLTNAVYVSLASSPLISPGVCFLLPLIPTSG